MGPNMITVSPFELQCYSQPTNFQIQVRQSAAVLWRWRYVRYLRKCLSFMTPRQALTAPSHWESSR